MKSVGFRAECEGINWAIVQGSTAQPVLIAYDYIPAPKVNAEPARLAYFRERVLAVVRLHEPASAFVRFPEAYGRGNKNITSNDARLRVEGVILEALNASGVRVLTGALRPIAARLGSDEPKAYLSRDDLRGLAFPRKAPNSREAILAAVAALECHNADDANGCPGAG